MTATILIILFCLFNLFISFTCFCLTVYHQVRETKSGNHKFNTRECAFSVLVGLIPVLNLYLLHDFCLKDMLGFPGVSVVLDNFITGLITKNDKTE